MIIPKMHRYSWPVGQEHLNIPNQPSTNMGFLIIPTDFHIVQRGGSTTNQTRVLKNSSWKAALPTWPSTHAQARRVRAGLPRGFDFTAGDGSGISGQKCRMAGVGTGGQFGGLRMVKATRLFTITVIVIIIFFVF